MRKGVIFFYVFFLVCVLSSEIFASSYLMHTIESGDTYYSVGALNGVDVNAIEYINSKDSRFLKSGELIIVKEINEIKLNINGQNIDFEREPYIENGRVFVPIKVISDFFKVDQIVWNQKDKTATIIKDNKTIKIAIGSKTAYINEVTVELDAPPQLYIDTTYVPIRFISEAFNVENIEWDEDNYIVNIYDNILEEDGNPNIYSEEDLYWLSRIINCEAKYESFDGKIAIANIIINRTKNPSFPSTIKEVIFDTQYGVQFPTAYNGLINNEPSSECIEAAMAALQGENNVGDSIYFVNSKVALDSWIAKNRTYYNTVYSHDFYL